MGRQVDAVAGGRRQGVRGRRSAGAEEPGRVHADTARADRAPQHGGGEGAAEDVSIAHREHVLGWTARQQRRESRLAAPRVKQPVRDAAQAPQQLSHHSPSSRDTNASPQVIACISSTREE